MHNNLSNNNMCAVQKQSLPTLSLPEMVVWCNGVDSKVQTVRLSTCDAAAAMKQLQEKHQTSEKVSLILEAGALHSALQYNS